MPEVPIVLEDALPHLERVVDKKGHAVVVVAEGAGEELLGASVEVDAGGNKKLPPIGAWLTKQIKAYFKGAASVLRIHSKSKKKPPTAIIPGDDVAQPIQNAPGPRRHEPRGYCEVH